MSDCPQCAELRDARHKAQSELQAEAARLATALLTVKRLRETLRAVQCQLSGALELLSGPLNEE